MGEELSMDNIFAGSADIDTDNLFSGESEEEEEENPSKDNSQPGEDGEKKEDNENKAAEIDVDDLFTDGQSEGVGSEDKKEQDGDTPPKGDGTSPKNFYSSIAKALKEEGIFPDLDDETYDKVKTPQDFRDLVERQIQEGLDDRQKRIDIALSAGLEPNEIRQYENTMNFLNSIKDEQINDESEKGEKLRKDLIYQDFVNRGYSAERAQKEVKKSFNAGTDLEDAKEALKGNKEFFGGRYQALVQEAKNEQEEEIRERREQADKLRKSILEDKDVFGDLSVDKPTRQKIMDNLSKPVYKDPDTGQYLTIIQKYELEHRTDFLKNIGLIFTLTDGFKNLDGLVKGKVKKEIKKGLSDLERTLNNTSRTSDGNLNFVSGVNDDPDAFINKGWKLDV